MIVKAQLKPLDQWPERFKCCTKLTQIFPQYKNIVVKTNETIAEKVLCNFCSSRLGIVVGMLEISSGGYVPVELYDLDEGPANEQ